MGKSKSRRRGSSSIRSNRRDTVAIINPDGLLDTRPYFTDDEETRRRSNDIFNDTVIDGRVWTPHDPTRSFGTKRRTNNNRRNNPFSRLYWHFTSVVPFVKSYRKAKRVYRNIVCGQRMARRVMMFVTGHAGKGKARRLPKMTWRSKIRC